MASLPTPISVYLSCEECYELIRQELRKIPRKLRNRFVTASGAIGCDQIGIASRFGTARMRYNSATSDSWEKSTLTELPTFTEAGTGKRAAGSQERSEDKSFLASPFTLERVTKSRSQ
jgi:hypothetical protein